MIEYNNERSYHAALPPCACSVCGATGEQVWLDIDEECTRCRMARRKKDVVVDSDASALKALAVIGADQSARDRGAELAAIYRGEADTYEEFAVESEDDLSLAGEALREVKERLKVLVAERRKVTDPLNAVLVTVRNWFGPAEDALARCESALKAGILQYQSRVRVLNAAAVQETAAAAERGDVQAATAALARIETPAAPAGVSTAKRWTFRTTNISLVPTEFLAVNEVTVRAAMREALARGEVPGETWHVPGITFEQVEELRVR